MKCPACGTKLNEVVDSRPRNDQIRRRRECFNGHRFSTLETIVTLPRGGDWKRRAHGRYPQALVDQCLAEKAAGDTGLVISVRHGIPIDTLNDWIYRGTRAPKQRSSNSEKT